MTELAVTEETQRLVDSTDPTLAAAQALEIETQSDLEQASADLLSVKERWKAIEAERVAMKKPVDEAARRIQAFFKKPLDRLANCERIFKRKIAAYLDAQERERREAQRKADEEAERERKRLAKRAERARDSGKATKAEMLEDEAQAVAAPVVAAPTKPAGIGTREIVRFEIMDSAKVPREYLTVDEKKIRKVVQALKTEAEIPGVRVWMETTVAGRL